MPANQATKPESGARPDVVEHHAPPIVGDLRSAQLRDPRQSASLIS